MAVHKVTYTGLSDIRIMSKKDLADQQGIGVDGELKWDKTKSGHRPHVFIEDASDELLALFKAEGTFTVQEVNDRGEAQGSPIVKGAPLDDTGNTVVDKTKGTTSTRTAGTGRGSSTDSPL